MKDLICPGLFILLFIAVGSLGISNHTKPNGRKRSYNKGKKRKRKRSKPKAKHFDLIGRPLYYIYVLKDGRNVFYVGQTIDPDRREREHINSGKIYGGTAKEKYIACMNREPKLVVVEIVHSQEAANKAERRWAKKHGHTNTLLR